MTGLKRVTRVKSGGRHMWGGENEADRPAWRAACLSVYWNVM